jgi:hypothetical protein
MASVQLLSSPTATRRCFVINTTYAVVGLRASPQMLLSFRPLGGFAAERAEKQGFCQETTA